VGSESLGSVISVLVGMSFMCRGRPTLGWGGVPPPRTGHEDVTNGEQGGGSKCGARSDLSRRHSAQINQVGKATTRDGNAMSESMRELILSFVSSDPEQTWNVAAYTCRRAAS
jgi:hypothetical protein